MSCIYFLHSEKDQQWYIGCSSLPVIERFEAHTKGKVKSTRYRRPLFLAYFEQIETFSTARKREWHLKHPSGFLEKKSITEFLIKKKENWPIEGPVENRHSIV